MQTWRRSRLVLPSRFGGSMSNALWSIVSGRRFWLGPAPWVLLLLVLANDAVWHWKMALAESRRKNLAAGDMGAFNANGRCESSYGQALLMTWDSIPDARQQLLAILC